MKQLKELTQEEKAKKSVLAAYDSVNLINDLKTKELLDEDEEYRLKINKEHIGIMLEKDWFVTVLTPEQKVELEEINK